jgi:hypothetical protein
VYGIAATTLPPPKRAPFAHHRPAPAWPRCSRPAPPTTSQPASSSPFIKQRGVGRRTLQSEGSGSLLPRTRERSAFEEERIANGAGNFADSHPRKPGRAVSCSRKRAAASPRRPPIRATYRFRQFGKSVRNSLSLCQLAFWKEHAQP